MGKSCHLTHAPNGILTHDDANTLQQLYFRKGIRFYEKRPAVFPRTEGKPRKTTQAESTIGGKLEQPSVEGCDQRRRRILPYRSTLVWKRSVFCGLLRAASATHFDRWGWEHFLIGRSGFVGLDSRRDM